MLRRSVTYPLDDLLPFRLKLYAYSKQFQMCCVLDSNRIAAAADYNRYELLAGLGAVSIMETEPGKSFESLQEYHDTHHDWLFGTLAYHLQTETEPVLIPYITGTVANWPGMLFFQPETVVAVTIGNSGVWQIEIQSVQDPEAVYKAIMNYTDEAPGDVSAAVFTPVTTKADYLETVEQIKQDIVDGDYYEMNYCQQFVAQVQDFDPTAVSLVLSGLSPAPFSALLRYPGKALVCASPERFMMKQGDKLISQPIKGTRKRGQTDAEDAALKTDLLQSDKERAENVMIVDLVRNDLSHTCKPGSVHVEELFGIYSYRHVHQMVSTVTGFLQQNVRGIQAVKTSFPMGSMTGAPKVEVMKTIAKYEDTPRGIYSGSVGYIMPNGDFDFNVVIRSLVYDDATKQLSYHVGGAITYDSIAEAEYEECMVKAAGILSVFR